MTTPSQKVNPDQTGFSALHEAGGTPTIPPAPGAVADPSTLAEGDAPPRAIATPATVGKYRILEPGSIGGMGVVYKAYDAELDRVVALKVIKGGFVASDEELLRFHREAQAAARLHHPNIIAVYEIGQASGCPYFTMAFAAGGSLAQQRSRFAEPRAAAALLEKIARAVHAAHQRGILHRDLKPANILFDAHDNPLVSDFGLAKVVDASLELTRAGQLLGTPTYMAPEQASGRTDQVSAATDVWALGVILYELLTGQRPFKGMSQEDQLRNVRTAEPTRPRSLLRSLDPALETVILKCLEKEPARRYASAEALADDLARWLRSERVLARPPALYIRAGRAMRRHRAAVLGLLFAAVLVVLAAWAWRDRERSPSPDESGEKSSLEEKLVRLKRGEKVALLDKSGPPGWSRWQPRRNEGRTMLDMDKIFRVSSGKQAAMLELLPAAPKRYRLRAQVQHTDHWLPKDKSSGAVGIYFAHGKHVQDEGAMHNFFTWTFNDRTPAMMRLPENALPRNRGDLPADAGPISSVRLIFNVVQDRGAGVLRTNTFSGNTHRMFVPAGEAETMPWRSLEVEVSPEQIKTYWEGKLVPSFMQVRGKDGRFQQIDFCDPHHILRRVALINANIPNPKGSQTADLTLGAGVGLYVQQGAAAFRSVEIEPLP